MPRCQEAKPLADKFEDAAGARGALSALPTAELLLTPRGASQTPRDAEHIPNKQEGKGRNWPV